VSGILKGIARGLATEAGVEVCRGYMIERMRLVTAKDLYKAIKDGTHTMGVAEGKDRNFGKKWARVIEKLSYKGERIRREYLTAENVLEWLKMDRPDLASLIMNMNPQGIEWLREDVKQVYDFLFAKPQPQPKPALTLVKREQPKKEEPPPQPAESEPQQQEESPSEQQLEQPVQTQTEEKSTETPEKT